MLPQTTDNTHRSISDRAPASTALRRAAARDRRRILKRLDELDQVAELVSELPYGRRWAA